MHHRFTKVVAMAATVSILFTGCASDGTMTQTGQGAAIGTLGGAHWGPPSAPSAATRVAGP